MSQLRKAAELALEALELLDRNGGLGLDVHEYLRTKIEALRQALKYPEPIQVGVREFITMTLYKEDVVGMPVYWAQWPTEEEK